MGPLHHGGKNDLHSLRKETIGVVGYIMFYFENNVRMYVFFGGVLRPIREVHHPKKEKRNHFGS
jgi:hypothetical protein